MDTNLERPSYITRRLSVDINRMFELAEQLGALRDEKKKVEDRLKKLNKYIQEVDDRLSDMMALSETANFTCLGKTFYLTTKTHASAVAECKDDLYRALKEKGYGDLVYETVNANLLASFVREHLSENEDALPEWLAGLVNVYEDTTVGVRKATRKKLR